jgi:hypothetical protein
MARLNEIQNNINRRVTNAYKQAGIDLDTDGPKTQEDRLSTSGMSPERKAQVEQYLQMKKSKAKPK